jgi:hypothetical protein
MNQLEFGELSIIQDTTNDHNESPDKSQLNAHNLEDTIDLEFRKLAMNPDQSIDDSAVFDIYYGMSNTRKSKDLKSDRVMEPRWKILNESKFDCER